MRIAVSDTEPVMEKTRAERYNETKMRNQLLAVMFPGGRRIPVEQFANVSDWLDVSVQLRKNCNTV